MRFGVWMRMERSALAKRVRRKVLSGVGGAAAGPKGWKCGFRWCGLGRKSVGVEFRGQVVIWEAVVGGGFEVLIRGAMLLCELDGRGDGGLVRRSQNIQ